MINQKSFVDTIKKKQGVIKKGIIMKPFIRKEVIKKPSFKNIPVKKRITISNKV